MYDLLSPEPAREKDVVKHTGRSAVYYVAAAQVRSGNLLISESDCVLLNTGKKNSHFRYESAAIFIHFKPEVMTQMSGFMYLFLHLLIMN